MNDFETDVMLVACDIPVASISKTGNLYKTSRNNFSSQFLQHKHQRIRGNIGELTGMAVVTSISCELKVRPRTRDMTSIGGGGVTLLCPHP